MGMGIEQTNELLEKMNELTRQASLVIQENETTILQLRVEKLEKENKELKESIGLVKRYINEIEI